MPGKTGGKESKSVAKGKPSQTGTKGKAPKRKTSDAGSETSSKAPDAVSFEICQSEGNTFRGMGMYKKAVNSYTRALTMKPRHKSVLLSRSQCYQQLGNNELALADANDIVSQDTASVKGLLQKADVFYQMGQFEYSLMLYHRGHKLRPEIQGFRLGIQKSKEAIENSIGEDAGIKLEKKGDLSFFIEEQKPPNKRKDANQQHRSTAYQHQQQHQRQQDKKASQNKKRTGSDKDKKTVKQLLGELYDDVTYLEGLLDESERTTQTQTNDQVTDLASECLDYLDSRAEFWQQQQPTYSREQERRNRTKGQDATGTLNQKKKEKRKEDPTKWIIENLEDIDDALDMKEYEECIDRCSHVLKEIDKYPESEIPRKMEFVSDVHSYMGNAYAEMEEYEQAIEHHLKDYELSKNNDQSHGMSRALDNLGRAQAKSGNHKKAIKIFTERLSQNCTTLEKAWLYHEIGRCHLELEETEKARNFGEKSRSSAAEAEDEVWQLNSSILIAQAQLKLKQSELALETFEKALLMAQSLEDNAAEQAIRNTINTIKKDIEPKQTTEEIEPTEAEPKQETEPKEVKPKQEPEPKEVKPKQEPEPKEVKPKQEPEPKEVKPKQEPEPKEVKPKQEPESKEVKPKQEPESKEVKPKQEPESKEVKPKQEPESKEVKPKQEPEPKEVKPKQEPEPKEVKPKQEPEPKEVKPKQEPEPKEVKPKQEPEPKEVKPKQEPEPKEVKPKQEPEPKEVKPKQEPELKEAEPKETSKIERVEPPNKGNESAKIEPKPTQKAETPKTQKPDETNQITTYKITVKISDIANAGTDSELEVEIFGQRGKTGREKLKHSETNTRKHDRGQSDTFTVVAKDVGEISKICVVQTSDLPGLGCHIAEVSVRSTSGSEVPTVFHCYSWFDKAHDDGLTEREFTPMVATSEDATKEKDGTDKEKEEHEKKS